MAETKKATAQKSATMLDFSNKVVERELGFKPRINLKNLCVGTIESVKIEKHTTEKYDENGAEKGYEYAGMEIPSLLIRFRQIPTKDDPANRYFNYRVTIISSKDKEGRDIDQDKVIALWKRTYEQLRHITNAFVGLKGYVDTESCPGVDIAASPETKVEQFEAFLQYFVDILTREVEDTKKPLFEGVNLYMKLVAEYKYGKYLTFPNFVGRGFIERVKPNVNPTLEFAPGETVQLAESNKKKSAVEKAAAMVQEDEVDPEIEKLLGDLE